MKTTIFSYNFLAKPLVKDSML